MRQVFADRIKKMEELKKTGGMTFEKQQAERKAQAEADEEWHKQYKKECKKAKKRKIAAAHESLEDPLSASVMGFASFGAKKKHWIKCPFSIFSDTF